jgi:hypothetical protein
MSVVEEEEDVIMKVCYSIKSIENKLKIFFYREVHSTLIS